MKLLLHESCNLEHTNVTGAVSWLIFIHLQAFQSLCLLHLPHDGLCPLLTMVSCLQPFAHTLFLFWDFLLHLVLNSGPSYPESFLDGTPLTSGPLQPPVTPMITALMALAVTVALKGRPTSGSSFFPQSPAPGLAQSQRWVDVCGREEISSRAAPKQLSVWRGHRRPTS